MARGGVGQGLARCAALAAVLLLACGLVGLTGCKYTDVIRETIYTQDAEEVDENADPIINWVDDSDDDDTDMADDQQEEDAQEDLDEQVPQASADEAGEGGQGGGTGGGSGTGGSGSTASPDAEEAQEDPEAQEEPESDYTDEDEKQETTEESGDDPEEGGQGSDSGSKKTGEGSGDDKGSKGKAIDAGGSYERLPSDVGMVAAPGELANIVCMVAGPEHLAATSGDFQQAAASVTSAWSAVSSLPVAFEDGNSGTLTSTGLSTLIDLYQQGGCEAVLVTSIPDDQKQQLMDAGINVYVMGLDTLDTIKTTVKAIGRILDEKTDGASSQKASQYMDFCTRIAQSCEGNSGQYTLFLSDWDDQASWVVSSGSVTLASGTGAAATKTSEAAVVSECLADAGVTNTPSTSSYGGQKGGLYWFSPFSRTVGTYAITGSSLGSNVKYSNSSASPTRVFSLVNPDNPDGVCLGRTGFKAVIAADATVAAGVQHSRDNSGLYQACPILPDRIVAVYGVGLSTADGSHYALSYLGDGTTTGSDCYKVYTAPHGLYSDWTAGSVESVLLTPWASQKFYGTSTTESLVREFYQTFYGVDLTASQYASIVEEVGE